MRCLQINHNTGEFGLNCEAIGNYIEVVVISGENCTVTDGQGQEHRGMQFVFRITHSLEHSPDKTEEVMCFLKRPPVVLRLLQCIRDAQVHRFRPVRLQNRHGTWFDYAIDGKTPGILYNPIPNN